MPKDRVVLVDGSSMIYRAFFAIPSNFSTATGVHTNATYGFALMFRKLFAGRNPSFGAVIFDAPGKTFRDEKYPEYKATRSRMPDELRDQLKWIDRLVDANNFPTLRVVGYEADDVIGTLAREAVEAGMEVVIVSGDKDFAQLIGDDVKMLDTIRDITYDRELVRKKWGVQPEQMVDLLALMGDKIDNIPGVPGIGQKGAGQLLEKYGSLDGILEHVGELKGRQKNALTEHKDDAKLSQELATIDVRVPLSEKVTELKIVPPESSVLNTLYKELEFYSLLDQEDVAGEFDDTELDYRVIADAAELKSALEGLSTKSPVGVSPIVDLPSYVTGNVCGLAFSDRTGAGFYAPLAGEGALVDDDGRAALATWFGDPERPKVAHNIKRLRVVLHRLGMAVDGVAGDTMLASFLNDPNALIPHGLEQISKGYIQRTLRPVKNLTGAGKSEVALSTLSVDDVGSYACHLADAVFSVWPPVEERLDEEGQRKWLEEVDLPLSEVLGQMEIDGILVDPDDLDRMGQELRERLSGYQRRIWELAGREFNIGSTKQLSAVLFDELKLPVIKRTKTGYSTNQEVLERLSVEHEIARLLLEHRRLSKLINTYTDVLSTAVDPDTGRIHATFQQTVGVTGRLITTEPDLQRTPVRTAEGKRIRETFIAPPGHLLIAADWSQIELRLLAHVSEDALLIESFVEDLDVHKRTASELFDVPLEHVNDEQRSVGKTVNFATIYGQGATALAQSLKVPRREAQRYIDQYFQTYAGVRRWLDATIAQAEETGFVETMFGRRRYIPELRSNNFTDHAYGQRIAANTPIQGSGADICKLAMLRITERLHAEDRATRMLLQVHDELIFEAPEAEVEPVSAMVKEVMETVTQLKVPLVVDVGAGPNWGAAKA